MSSLVEESYRECARQTRKAASNFALSFLVLPRDKRRAMYALYAFLRHTDDLGDNSLPLESRRQALADWRRAFERALSGSFEHDTLRALVDSVERFSIPPEHLRAVIDGVEMDLAEPHFATFDDLAAYCHRVASAVGLACIHIWGFRGPEAIAPAQACGLAFQLTNILRDLREDAQQGRTYLPEEDLQRFGYTPADLAASVLDERFSALMQFELERTEVFYREAEALSGYLEPDGQAIFGAMFDTYRELLAEIRRRPAEVFQRRVQLSPWRKLAILGWWFLPQPLVRWSRSGVRADPA